MLLKLSTFYADCSTGSSIGRTEEKDCCVRALSLAANIPYDEAHGLFKAEGRVNKMPTYDASVFAAIAAHDGVKVAGNGSWGPGTITVAQFLKRFPKGRYFVVRKGHAFAIINGVMHDWQHGTGPRSHIRFAFELPERKD